MPHRAPSHHAAQCRLAICVSPARCRQSAKTASPLACSRIRRVPLCATTATTPSLMQPRTNSGNQFCPLLPATRSLSTIPNGRIIRPVSTACARREPGAANWCSAHALGLAGRIWRRGASPDRERWACQRLGAGESIGQVRSRVWSSQDAGSSKDSR